MNASMLRVPASEDGDAGDVAVALEVAGALWKKGDHAEALRWVRRAAEAANESGDAARSANLAQAAQALEAARRADAETPPAPISSGAADDGEPASGPRAAQRPEGDSGGAPAVPSPGDPAEGVRVRVSVRTSMRDPGLLLARRLPEGEAPPPGTREGFLVFPAPASTSVPSDGTVPS